MPGIVFLFLTVVFVAAVAFSAYLYFDRQRLKKSLDKSRNELRDMIILEDTQQEKPAIPPIQWDRYTSPLPPVSTTLAHRLMKQSQGYDHYPFSLPSWQPVARPRKMMVTGIAQVTMRANDWVETRDGAGFVINEYSGLWQNVGDTVRERFQGEWLVPKQLTGYHKVIRFKYVRPSDHPAGIHPRQLPEVKRDIPSQPPEMSPL